MKRKYIHSSWLYCKARRGEITVAEGFTDSCGREYKSTSVHKWEHDGFVMTYLSMGDESLDAIPPQRIYGWSSIAGRPRKLSIQDMIKSHVPVDVIKTAICPQ
jgi:hypothetical protein